MESAERGPDDPTSENLGLPENPTPKVLGISARSHLSTCSGDSNLDSAGGVCLGGAEEVRGSSAGLFCTGAGLGASGSFFTGWGFSFGVEGSGGVLELLSSCWEDCWSAAKRANRLARIWNS